MSFPWAKHYEPKQPLMRWLDEKLPLPRLVYNAVGAGYPVPRNLNYFWNFGVLAGVCLVHPDRHRHRAGDALCAPTPASRSTRSSTSCATSTAGWLLRYAHANGASMFFVVVYIHIFRGLYYGSYKAPREMVWLLGVVIFLLMMATAFMGYVLPWGQMSFWGAKVITGLFWRSRWSASRSSIWLLGGFAPDNAALNRFFSLHYLLPFVIAGVVILHIWALHIPGSSNPTGVEVKGEQDTVPFHPYYTAKDGFGLGVFLIVFAALMFFAPNLLGHPDNYIPANPLSTPAHIVPEWYFWPFYAILRAFTVDFIHARPSCGACWRCSASILLLFFLPWLDKSPVRSGNYRPLYRDSSSGCWSLDVLVLGYCGGAPAEEPLRDAQPDRDGLLFRALPDHPADRLARSSGPMPLPNSITEAVLGEARRHQPGADRDGQLSADKGRIRHMVRVHRRNPRRARLRRRAGAGRCSARSSTCDHRAGAPRRPSTSSTSIRKELRLAVGRAVRQVRPAAAPARLPGLQGSLRGLPLAQAASRSATSSDSAITEAEVKAIADQWAIEVPSIDPDTGEAGDAPGDRRPTTSRRPIANDVAARAANNNALPPDLSLMTKARHDGAGLRLFAADRLSEPAGRAAARSSRTPRRRTGCTTTPISRTSTSRWPPPLTADGQVTYADGTKATRDQMARDVSAFLIWTAEPKLEARHGAGLAAVLFLLIFCFLAWGAYQNVWRGVKH